MATGPDMSIAAQVQRKLSARAALRSPAACRALRQAAGLSQQDIADIVGVTRAEISRWESGERSPRAGEQRQRYGQVLDELAQRVGQP